jgi:hypothetical protein
MFRALLLWLGFWLRDTPHCTRSEVERMIELECR